MTTTDSPTYRTRKDLRYLTDIVVENTTQIEGADDTQRNTRLMDHGWLTSQGKLTGWGHDIVRVTRRLDERETLDITIDIVGMDAYIETCTTSEEPFAYLAGARTIVNLLDEARHDTGRQDAEFDHDGAFSPHFAEFTPRDDEITLRFETIPVANAFRFGWCRDRWDVECAHDERFNGNRNPRRLVVTVL